MMIIIMTTIITIITIIDTSIMFSFMICVFLYCTFFKYKEYIHYL